jgi:oxaloacetate decarboxylase alpha subunit
MALGTSQPATEPMVATLKDTPYSTGYDLNLLSEIADYFKPIKDEYIKSGLLDVKMLGVDVNTLIYQVPGGMLSNLVSQLKQSNALDKYEEVLKEVPKVREDFGFPPLVTPTSQIVGTQAVLNVIMGERYKMVPKESKALVKGEYGKTPAPIPEGITRQILKDEETITCRPADLIEPELDSIRAQMNEYMEQDEDVLSYALFPPVAEKFFQYRNAMKNKKNEPSKDGNVDEKVAAAISAAVASIETEPGLKLVVSSFRKVQQPSSIWNTAGRLARLQSKL